MTEEWRAVVGYEGLYEVSDMGRVRGLKSGKVLTAQLSRLGYTFLNLYRDRRMKSKKVHRLVLEAFRGKAPPDPRSPFRHKRKTAGHRNGVRHDNRLENLSWQTWEEQTAQLIADGVHKACVRRGESHVFAKLSEADVRKIRDLTPRWSCRELARKFGVSAATVCRANTRETWRHVA